MNAIAEPLARPDGRAARKTASGPDPLRRFWALPGGKHAPGAVGQRLAFQTLVERVNASTATTLHEAIESGVPTSMVAVIAGATGESAASVMDLIGVSLTTFRRKEEAKEPLPDVAGHRVMALLRVVATLRRLLAESGDAPQLRDFDLERWVAGWLRQGLPELGGKTPAEMLRNPEGQRAVEQVLERMRGGLPA